MEKKLSKIRTHTAIGNCFLTQPIVEAASSASYGKAMSSSTDNSSASIISVVSNVVSSKSSQSGGSDVPDPSEGGNTKSSTDSKTTDTTDVPQTPSRSAKGQDSETPASSVASSLESSPGSINSIQVLECYQVNEYFEVRLSPLGGLGCFAIQDLNEHVHILRERPILRTSVYELFIDFERLEPAKQQVVMGLHGWTTKKYCSDLEKIWTCNA